jgi:hypothetical protein
MKKMFKKVVEAITAPIVGLIVHIGTSIELNEDGSWDKHHERKNRRASR